MNVLIVGAGPTGLTAATELARRGIMPSVVDRRDQASALSRAVGITPRSLELLSHSGVAKKLINAGVPMIGARIYSGQKQLVRVPLHSDRAYFPTILGLPQDKTESIMAGVLSELGGSIRYGVELTKLTDSEGKMLARFGDGSQGLFDIVIGADGVGSKVRESAGIAYDGIDLDEVWSIADVESDTWRHPNELSLVLAGPGSVLVVAPMGATRYRVVSSTANALDALPLPMVTTKIRRESTFNISVRQATRYSAGCVHIAGDAAHCHSPVGGRGMNLGIADAAELAERIANGEISGYSPARHHVGAETIRATERGRRLTGGMRWHQRALIRSVLTAVRFSGPLKKTLGRFLVEF